MRRTFVAASLFAFAACASVLGIRATPSHPFEHRIHALDGIRCVECHDSIRGTTATSAVRLPDAATCVPCHEEPHDTRDCLACHGDEAVRRRVHDARTHLTFDHRAHLPEVDDQCVRCHTGVRAGDDQMTARMGTCFGCHGHEDDFEVRQCDRCHVRLADEAVVPSTHVVHAADFVQTHGAQASASADLCRTCHDDRSCASCHGVDVPALPWRLNVGAPERTGLHRAGFAARHAVEARIDPGSCASCHAPSTCQSCHMDENVSAVTGRASPHPPEWVKGGSGRHGIAARRDPLSCASCHGGAGESLCVDCHRVGAIGGSPHPPGYTSPRSASRDVPCRWCHLP